MPTGNAILACCPCRRYKTRTEEKETRTTADAMRGGFLFDDATRIPYTLGTRHMNLTKNKAKSLTSVKQAQGTLAAVIAMIEDGRYCPEIIQQADSVIGLLKAAKRELLAGHLDTCVAARMKENKKAAIDELIKIYNLSA